MRVIGTRLGDAGRTMRRQAQGVEGGVDVNAKWVEQSPEIGVDSGEGDYEFVLQFS